MLLGPRSALRDGNATYRTLNDDEMTRVGSVSTARAARTRRLPVWRGDVPNGSWPPSGQAGERCSCKATQVTFERTSTIVSRSTVRVVV